MKGEAMSSSYACTVCGKETTRDELSTKKVLFAGIGHGATVFRSRTVDWMCDDCLGQDRDYNQPKDQSRTDRMRVARARRKENEAAEHAASEEGGVRAVP